MRIAEVQHERVFEVKNECSIRLMQSRGRYSGAVSADSAADVPDGALRPALEFAVGMAAAGAKVRPPLSFPAELKRFLRFHKLPPAALAQVRAAVEGDDDFRKRLASVATTDLVDEVGVLWLSRPEGWAEAITDLLPEKVVDDETALRREERDASRRTGSSGAGDVRSCLSVVRRTGPRARRQGRADGRG